MDWKKYWNETPNKFGETEFLKQLGKTVSGVPITSDQFSAQLADIRKALNINSNDLILDLCCGNGIITAQLSKECSIIVGIDFSDPLISIAKKYNMPSNVRYYCMSALDPKIKFITDKPFTKVYMYEALQHFEENDLEILLMQIKDISNPEVVIFLGGIPDIDKIWDFYDTKERRLDYEVRKKENREAIGTWWRQSIIHEASKKCGFESMVLAQNALLHSAHYRFDVLLTRS